MKKLLCVVTVGIIALSASSLRADLLGSKVTGSLTFGPDKMTNYFDPATGFVPAEAGYGNSSSPKDVVINSLVEFGFSDDANRDTADFTGTRLTVRDVCLAGSNCTVNASFQMIFSDLAFGSAALLTNDLGVTFSFAGDVLTVNYPGQFVANDNATAVFGIGTAAQTPEPGTLGLVATGILGATGALRRRYLAQS